MKVLAIGSTGFIGRHVVSLLARDGHEVAVVHRGQTRGAVPDGLRRFFGDRSTLAELRADFRAFRPDVVLDLIPFTQADGRQLVEVFRGITGRLVVVSSADVYRNYDGFRGRPTAPPDPDPLRESSPVRERYFPYRGLGPDMAEYHDYEKLLVERAVCGQPDMHATVVRLPAVYGPGDRQHRLRAYLRRMFDRRPVIFLQPGESRFRWTRGYVENVAAAVALTVISSTQEDRTYNVGPTATPLEREWVEIIASVVGWEGQVLELDPDDPLAEADPSKDWRYSLALDTRRLREELGYNEPVTQAEGIERTVEWERSDPAFGTARRDYAAEDAAFARIRQARDQV